MDPSGTSSPPPESSALSSHDTPDLESFDPITSSSSAKRHRQKPTERRRIRTSFVWKHMPGPIDTIYQREGSEAIYWRCKYFLKEYRESGGTAFIAVHLQAVHEIVDSQEQQNTLQQLSISTSMARGLETQYKRRRLDSVQSTTIDPSTLEQLFIQWTSRCSVSFNMVEISESETSMHTLIQRSTTGFQQVIVLYINGQ
jgi:hypothetical protein